MAQVAVQKNVTRSAVCMEKAVMDENNRIFAIGNAPIALIRLAELIEEGVARPYLVIGVPVGFVNVVESIVFFYLFHCRNTFPFHGIIHIF